MDLITLFFGILAYKAFDKRLFLLFISIIVGILVVLASKYAATFGNNIYISYIHAPYEAIMFSAILYPTIEQKRARMVVKTAILLIFSVNLLEGLLIEDGFSKYNSYTYILINSLIGTLAVKELLRIRSDNTIDNIIHSPMFWIASGFTILHLGLLVVWAFLRTAQENSIQLLWQLTFIKHVVIYIALILWIIAFWVARKAYYKAQEKSL